MAGKYLYATNFEQKFSNGFTVYQIKLEERATTTQENGFLQLSHNDDFENGEFDNFEENIEVGCTYELLAKPAKRTDSKTEMEQLRLSILPLITAFTTDMDGTSINVQRYYGIDYTVPKAGIPRICYILAENCEGLPLDCYMYALQGKNENSGTVFGYIEQILKGLEFLHRNCIIHRDIRGANVIVLKDKRLVKIAGLTMIKHFHGDKTPSRTLGIATGTVPFVSPEMAALTSLPQQKKQHVGRTTDIWSFGCVIIQMIQKGRPPSFTRGIRDVPLPLLPSEVTLKDMNKYFEMGYKPVYPSAHKCDHRVCGNQSPARCLLLTEGILILLENCLIPLPDLRPSAAKLLELLETFSRAKKGLNNEPENAGDPQANILASHHCDPFADCELPKKFTNSADTIKNPGDTITQLVEHELPVTENVQLAVKMLRLEDDVESTSQGVERSTKAEATHQFLSHDEAELGATYSEPDKTLSFSEFKPFPFFDQSFRIEIQRFLIARFILRPDSITATDDKDKLNLPDLIKSSLGHEDNAVKEKIVIPGGFRGGNALSGVSVILLRDNDSWDGPLFQNKRDVFDKLIKHSGEKSEIIKHLAIARTVQKFWIFTESEDCLQPLSTLIALTGCQKIDTSLFRSFTKQMLLGLTFLHNNRIIHKDIRCDNVLVRQQECPLKKKEYFLKLAHFEKAAFHDLNSKDNKILNIAEGSSRFASTEMQKLASFDWDDSIDVIGTLTDVFSLGCTVLEMYQRSPPNWIYTEKERQKESLFVFAPENKFDDFLANLRGLRNVGANPDISCINEKDALDFVRRCLLPRPERPSSSSLNEMHVFTKEASAKQGSPARYQVSKDEFRLAVIVNGFPQPTDSQYESFAKGVPYGHFTSRRELGMFLANILHESAGLRYRKEISPQPEYGKYYGRGYMQLTWEDNYRKASQALYHDDRLVENPDQVADDEDVAWATACWYWGAVVHSYPGVAEGKFGASIRAINSEEEGMGRNEVKSRARNEYYKRILAVFVPGEAPVESGS
ncbi:uncharacterized protein LOC129597313 isoform X1 [Paramacrobiotus metropolitanus]|uniref:uncharacterized protein LOC129597313 isoform X1 n=1 Tax=Paramacrobiotus metropolitanus TaxID=2943436 RepID=UPI00244655CE|nr:uncharacterized protein LOC129597313 isoform X1 [Paramacrobiotus metropolitanus]XP_055350769.1 uncharacterized protein LOC129597313 isoform X1 [Paramacrobiotus metropolitanus]